MIGPVNHTVRPSPRSERGFSLIELLVAMTLLLIVSAGMMEAMLRLSRVESLVFNRSAMHDGVRSATELLQQEVGQAGSVTLPAPVTLTAAVAAGPNTVTVSSASNMFVNEYLVVGAGATEETVQVTAVGTSPASITATFTLAHNAGAPVAVRGGFATGIVPCVNQASCPGSALAGATFANGSTGYLLKMYGDINDDGRMVYVEYKCDLTNAAAGNGILYRTVIDNAVTAGAAPAKAAPGPTQVLLDNLADPDSGRVPCFVYQQQVVPPNTYVINVAISLTTRAQFRDRSAGIQKETKSLLNVAPRNVFNSWLLASMANANRVQFMPASITALLPTP
jgi:prepilin-type N-terminal cleavage/methylation domain-containing protein